jgi:Mg-chelatase subunit ChlD
MFGFGNKNNTNGTNDHTVARTVKLVKDATGSSAVDLSKVENTGGIDLSKKTQAVVTSLAKNNLAGIRAQVMVVLDHSGSMMGNYESGQVQMLVERFLGFGLAVDADGEIPVIAFDHKLHSAVNVNITNYTGVVASKIYKPSQMGSTDLTKALEKVRDEAKKTDAPLFVAIVTDGEPDSRDSAREVIKDLARYPVFIKFLAVAPVRFLRELDDMSNSERLLDNVDTKAYSSLITVSDEQFAADMVDEWHGWVKAATAAGILTV